MAKDDEREKKDNEMMGLALREASLALEEGEVPVGCVVADSGTGEILAHGRNATHATGDASTHAEVVALRALENLTSQVAYLTLYVTCEPCVMCAAAITSTRLFTRIVYGCANARFGGCGSIRCINPNDDDVEITTGVRVEDALKYLTAFYEVSNPYSPNPKPRKRKRDITAKGE